VLKDLGKGLLARSLAYAVFGLGFWLLFQGFLKPSVVLGILGGAMIPFGMYLIVKARRASILPPDLTPEDNQEPENMTEEDSIDPTPDPIDRSR